MTDVNVETKGKIGSPVEEAIEKSTQVDHTMEILLTGKDPYDKTLARLMWPDQKCSLNISSSYSV